MLTSTEINSKFFEACEKGRLNEVRIMKLNPLLDVNRYYVKSSLLMTLFRLANVKKSTPLHASVENNHSDIVLELLLCDNIKINVLDSEKRTPEKLAKSKRIQKLFRDYREYGRSNFKKKYSFEDDDKKSDYSSIPSSGGKTPVDNQIRSNDDEFDYCKSLFTLNLYHFWNKEEESTSLDLNQQDIYDMMMSTDYEKIFVKTNIEEFDHLNVDEMKEKEERVQYLLETKEFHDLSIDVENFGSFSCFKSLFYEKGDFYKDKNGKMSVTTTWKSSLFSFSENIFGMLFGISDPDKCPSLLQLSSKELVNMFVTSDILKLDDVKYLILKILEKKLSSSFENLLVTYEHCFSRLKESSSLILVLLNLLKQKFVKKMLSIDCSDLEDSILIRTKLKAVVAKHKYMDILWHPDFIEKRDVISASENKFFRDQRGVLYFSRQKFFNLRIATKDKLSMNAHFEVLFSESDYFSKVLKFEFSEFDRKTRVLTLSRLTKSQVGILLKYIYLKKIEIDENSLASSFELLVEISPYSDKTFIEVFKKKIKEFSYVLIKKGTFFQVFKKIAYFFHELWIGFKLKDKSYFLSYWFQLLKENSEENVFVLRYVLKQLILSSFFQYQTTQKLRTLSSKYANLKEKLQRKEEAKIGGSVKT